MSVDPHLRKTLTGKRVFLTGHTGFKGSWMTCWLLQCGCHVTGYSLPAETNPNLFTITQLQDQLTGHHLNDIRDAKSLGDAMLKAEPEVVIHFAAQPLVRRSYDEPEETWSTNVMGTVNLMEAIRNCPTIKAVLVITTDKCYENREWVWGYREDDPLGGHDPYSASKAGAELVVQSYRKSYFSNRGPLVASARAGNVIGGGDWSEDRLIPDAVRAIEEGKTLMIRSPNATRPWQHVLDCLYGYLLLVAELLEGKSEFASAFNFGPAVGDNLPVEQMLSKLQVYWPELSWQIDQDAISLAPHEANYLYLDSSLSRQKLKWLPHWQLEDALEKTASWYSAIHDDPTQALAFTNQQIKEYINP